MSEMPWKASETSPTDDPLRGSAEFKRYITEVFVRRGLEKAMERSEEVI